METQINKIIKNNAISAYLMFGISWMLLFSKKNLNINNYFVRSHVKSAFLIHFLIILDIIFFRIYKIFSWFFILDFSFDFIIFTILITILFITLFLWIYKSYNWTLFKIGNFFIINSEKKVLDINKDWNFWEKDKVTLILAFIPLLWQIFTSKYSKNQNIKEILKLNTFVTVILSLLFINEYNNLNQILNLMYFIFIAFIGINLFSKWELIIINLPNFLDFNEIWKKFKIFFKYIKNYMTWNFLEFNILTEEENKKIFEKNTKDYKEMNLLNDLKWPKKIIYFPIINLYFIFFKKNKYQIHIRNGLIISFLVIIFLMLIFLKIFSIKILILFLLPISFWIWNLEKNYYKIPIIYDIYEILNSIILIFRKYKNLILEKRKEVKEIKIKVWENKKEEK